jgi:hypothetical protein
MIEESRNGGTQEMSVANRDKELESGRCRNIDGRGIYRR